MTRKIAVRDRYSLYHNDIFYIYKFSEAVNKCVNIHNLSYDYLKFEAHFDCFSSYFLLNIFDLQRNIYFPELCAY